MTRGRRRFARAHGLQARRACRETDLRQLLLNFLVQRGDAVVIEARGDGAEHRHLFDRLGEGVAVALHLFADVAVGVLGALAIELVDRDHVGEIEHVDFFELALGAEFRRHDVQRGIDQRHDGGITLADAGRFDDDEVECAQLAGRHHVADDLGNFADRVACGDRAHVDIGVVDGIHADAIAEQ